MSTPSKTDSLHLKAQEGIKLFNQGKYYQAHDLLEEAWMDSPSPERDLYQGILQIGLAYYQITRGNYRGSLKMFQLAKHNLSLLGIALLGIDIARLQADAQSVESALRQLGSTGIDQLDPELIRPVPEV